MRNPTKLAIAALFTSLLFAHAAPAQKNPNRGPSPNQPGIPNPQISAGQSPSGPMLNLQFPGGTVTEFVTAVREAAAAAGGAVNIIVPADAAKVIAPPMSLQMVRPQTALTAFCAAFRQNKDHYFSVDDVGIDSAEAPSFVLYYERNPNLAARGGMPVQPPPRVTIEVFSIRDIVEPATIRGNEPPNEIAAQADVNKNNLLRAIDAALSLKDQDTRADDDTSVLCHDQSGLLIVRGEPARIEVVRSVLSRMRDDTFARRKAESSKAERESARARRAAVVESRLKLQQAEMDTAQSRFDRTAQLHSQGQASVEALEEAKLNVVRAQAAMAQVEADFAEVENAGGMEKGPGAASPPPADEPISTATYRLKYGAAARISGLASAIIATCPGSNKEYAQADPTQNTVVATTTKAKHTLIQLAIDTIDAVAESVKSNR